MRWKFLVPALIFVAIVIIFNIVFLDALIRRALIAGGEMAFGAKVEIGRVTTRFKDLSITVSGIAVADKNMPLQNLFEIGRVRGALQPLPLLSKKCIIDTMSAEGICWGTSRTSSGALPKRKQKKYAAAQKKGIAAKLADSLKKKAAAEAAALPALDTLQKMQKDIASLSVDKVIGSLNLTSLKEMETLRNDLDQKYRAYESSISSLNVTAKAQAAQSAAQDLAALHMESVADVAAAREKIARLNDTRLDLERSIAAINDVRSQFAADIGEQRTLLDRINQLKDADIQAVSAALRIPSLSWTAAAQALFGPVWIARVEKTMQYIHIVRNYMPARKKDDPVVEFARARGTDIAFPRREELPSFLIKQVQLSGTTGGRGKRVAAIDFSGSVYDITSDQAQLGRPTRFDVTGTQGQTAIGLEGLFNHTGETPEDTIAFNVTGLPARDLRLPDSPYLPSFGRAHMNARGVFSVIGDQIQCSLDVAVDGVSYSTATAAEQQNAEIMQLVADLWKGISAIEVTGTLTGPAEALQLAVHSNLDAIMGDRLKGLFGSKMQDLSARIRAEIDARTDEKKQELLAEFTRRKDAVLKEYAGKQKELESARAGVTAGIADAQREIDRQAEQEKKKAENALKKQAEEKLQGLFGR